MDITDLREMPASIEPSPVA